LFVCFVLLFQTRSHYVAQAGLELAIFLSQPLGYWDDRGGPPCPAVIVTFEDSEIIFYVISTSE
jgi:hypothetical protein